MGKYRDVVYEIEEHLQDWTKSPDYHYREIPGIIGFLLQENSELTYKVGLMRDLIDGNVECVLCGDSV